MQWLRIRKIRRKWFGGGDGANTKDKEATVMERIGREHENEG